MSAYIVIRKTDGAEVYRYSAGAPVEWMGMEFATHHHNAIEEGPPIEPPIVDSEWYINVGPFFDRFGAYKLPILASVDPLVQAVIKDSSVRKYIDLRGRRGELAQVLALLQSKGFPVNTTSILDTKPTGGEVFSG